MLTTIIFFFALLLSIALFKRMLNDITSDIIIDDIEPLLWFIVTILWSYFYYLIN